MKKYLYILLPFALLALFSCGPAEVGSTFNYYYDNIYTVNKHTVTAEDSDSMIRIDNMDNTELKTGDRAHMMLRYYYDYNTMSKPHCDIYHVYEVIPTLPLSTFDSVYLTEYTTPFNKLHQYELWDRYANPVWLLKMRQNINISYFGAKEGALFAMTVRGVSDDCIEFNLYAKAADGSGETNTRLLTFDLSNVGDFLTPEQISSLSTKRTIKSRIYLTRMEDGVSGEICIDGGEFPNPFIK